MNHTRKLSKKQKLLAEEALKPFGLKILGGSFNINTLKYDVLIDKGCAATYDFERVAEVLKKVLSAQSICLDGRYEY